MSEEAAAGPATPDPGGLAMELAMEEARANPALQDRVAAFLEDQRGLVAIQKRHLHRHLRLGLWEKRLSLLLRISTAFIGLAVASALGAMVWSAANDNGLVIEPFSVPSDLAARGLTGQVVATQMLDNLTNLQAPVGSVRAASSYANNWDNDIKVEIPQTGISIGQINAYLRQLLGNQTHISGEVVRTASGITVTARAGSRAAQRFSGSEEEFDALLLQATTAVYADTQPYRYAVTLLSAGKFAQALEFLQGAARRETLAEQPWAYTGMFNTLQAQHRTAEADAAAKASVRLNPEFAWGWTKVSASAGSQGQAEAALAASRKAIRLLDADPAGSGLRPEAVAPTRQREAYVINLLLGEFDEYNQQQALRVPSMADADPARYIPDTMAVPGANVATAIDFPFRYMLGLLGAHDLAAVRRMHAQAPAFEAAIRLVTESRSDARGEANIDSARHAFRAAAMQLALAGQDWAQAAQDAAVLDAGEAKLNQAYASVVSLLPATFIWPARSIAEAQLGNFAAAHRWIDRTPGDCDLCLRTRGKIAALERRHGAADFWFARAVATAPSIPFAYHDWGRALLERGQPDAALAKFTLANTKSPKFADALQGWGEALMAQNQSHLALAKFQQAEKLAPNWGRLHLKWGQALVYARKPEEAKAKFARAAQLDLTPAEKSELSKVHP